jgi:hypothetical protein
MGFGEVVEEEVGLDFESSEDGRCDESISPPITLDPSTWPSAGENKNGLLIPLSPGIVNGETDLELLCLERELAASVSRYFDGDGEGDGDGPGTFPLSAAGGDDSTSDSWMVGDGGLINLRIGTLLFPPWNWDDPVWSTIEADEGAAVLGTEAKGGDEEDGGIEEDGW